MSGLLTGRATLITGAGRGIGAAAARLFAAEGASVVLAARTEDDLIAVVAAIRDDGGVADHAVADVATEEGAERAVAAVLDRHGRLDAAFVNAGVSTRHVPLAELTVAEFDRVSEVNFRGTFVMLGALVRAMRPTGGAIVTCSSVGSWRGAAGGAAYGAAKRAVNSLTESAAIECGPLGIRVNAVVPGPTRTHMMARWADEDPGVTAALTARTPLGRFAEPSEVAEAAAWLLSDRARFVTGAVLPVDGGFRA